MPGWQKAKTTRLRSRSPGEPGRKQWNKVVALPNKAIDNPQSKINQGLM
jgi:hypothetical protein